MGIELELELCSCCVTGMCVGACCAGSGADAPVGAKIVRLLKDAMFPVWVT
jgi:hypothetical protein